MVLQKKKPNFIIIGSCAGGTSFLSSILSKHKEIYLPKIQRPEPNFFHYTHKYKKGISYYLEEWFSNVKNEKAIGERSSLLLTSKYAPKRIFKHFPKIKIIATLRNPIERAWANYRFTCLEGLETDKFLNSLKKKHKYKDKFWSEVAPNNYIERSLYAGSIKEFVRLFGKKKILLIKSEDLNLHTTRELNKICEFLNVSKNFKFPRTPSFTSPNVKNLKVQKKLRKKYSEKFYKIIEQIRQNKLKSRKFNDVKKNITFNKESMDNNSRIFLNKILFRDIKKLIKYINFETEDWI